MKKLTAVFLAVLLLTGKAAWAVTTVTVDEDTVTVNKNEPQVVTVVHPVVPAPVTVRAEPVVVVAKVKDPRELEGEIIQVDYPGNKILVRDEDNRERRVLLKEGMITTYKTGDYVHIYLMADLQEAKTIRTQRTADLEGDIVGVDHVTSRIVLRDASGRENVVLVRPGFIGHYKPGDHLRVYVVSDYPDLKEVKMIRVR